MTNPQNTTPPSATPVPGKTLGIVSLILAFLLPLIGVILGIIASSQSRRAGVKNTPATVAMILGIIFLFLSLLGAWWFFNQAAQGFGAVETCLNNPTATVEIAGQTVDCADVQ